MLIWETIRFAARRTVAKCETRLVSTGEKITSLYIYGNNILDNATGIC